MHSHVHMFILVAAISSIFTSSHEYFKSLFFFTESCTCTVFTSESQHFRILTLGFSEQDAAEEILGEGGECPYKNRWKNYIHNKAR